MKWVSVFVFQLIGFTTSFAQVTNVAAGNWGNPASWNVGHVPAITDSVYLNYPVSVDVNACCKALNTYGHNVVINPGYNLNIPGANYLPDSTFTDQRDGQLYTFRHIGTQVWMTMNLTASTYRNGDPIPLVQDSATWVNSTTGAYCYYKYDAANGNIYGKLYNWYAVNDLRGIAPLGWHVPSDAEWKTLTDHLGGASIAGGTMKTTSGWKPPNTGATNCSGFSCLPGGFSGVLGIFFNIGDHSSLWSSTQYNTGNAWSRSFAYNRTDVLSYYSNFTYGFSVRCVRDQ